ncbi:MAG: hypothetical protein EOO16_05920 [Chitinophagaceae bacterium]|nr:MAG: hypothetical protein EOO16_05920 [Chitinophagaceae bacterium]
MRTVYFLLFLLLAPAANLRAQPAARRAATRALATEIRRLNYLRYEAPDTATPDRWELLERAPARMEALARRHAAAIAQLPDTTDYEFVSLAHSEDRRLTLLSWDTRLGGTMIQYAAIAIFRGADGRLRTKRIRDRSKTLPDPLMHYDEVHTRASGGDTCYVAYGKGQGSTALPWQELRVFRLRGNALAEAPVFPGNSSRLFVEFDTHDFKQEERIPVIRVEDSARRLLLPEAGQKNGFDGYYSVYRWSRGRYTLQKSRYYQKPKHH